MFVGGVPQLFVAIKQPLSCFARSPELHVADKRETLVAKPLPWDSSQAKQAAMIFGVSSACSY
jgi:hypothetical protein